MSSKEPKQQPSTLMTEDEAFAKRVIDIVVADLKANGRIKWALVGVFRDDESELKRTHLDLPNKNGLP